MLKDKMYEQGAVYAAMSGSGISVFGLFHDTPDEKSFVGCMDELTVFTVDMSDICFLLSCKAREIRDESQDTTIAHLPRYCN